MEDTTGMGEQDGIICRIIFDPDREILRSPRGVIRAFLAVNLPPDEHQAVVKISQELQQLPDVHLIRWVDPSAFHLTLAFLGDIREDQPAVVSAAISDIVQGIGPYSCSLTGLMAFPGWQRMRVLGIGISDPTQLLHRLQSDIVSALRSTGFELEGRPYQPHLTLGRVRKGSPAGMVDRLVGAFMNYRFELRSSWQVAEVNLIRSQLGSGPPRYTTLDSYHLGTTT